MPTLPASDGKDYNFPEGTSTETAIAFLKSKSLAVRFPSPETEGPSASFIGGGESASWEPQIRRSPMRGEPPQEFSMARAEENMKQNSPLIAAIGLSFYQPHIGIPMLTRMGIGSKFLQYAVNAGARVVGQSTAAGVTRAGVESAAGASNREALSAGLEEGKSFAKWGAAGEGIAALGTGAVVLKRAATPIVKNLLKKLPSGTAYEQKILTAVNEQAQNDAKALLDTVSSDVPTELTGGQAEKVIDTFDKFTIHRGTDLRNIPIGIASEAKLTADISPILQDLKGLLKATELDAGALTPLVGAEGRAVEVAKGARLGTMDVSKLGERAARLAQEGDLSKPLSEETAKKIEYLRNKIKEVIAAKTASTAALMDVQGTVSQILASSDIPLSLRRVAQRIGGGDFSNPTARINQMIRESLSDVGEDAVAAWDISQKYYGASQKVKEQALYGTLKRSPEKLADYMVPNRPQNVKMVRSIIDEAKKAPGAEQFPDLIPAIQRQWLKARLDSAGIGGIGEEIDKYGTKTVGALFREPQAARAVENLKGISSALNDKLTELGSKAEGTRDILAEVFFKAGMSRIPGGRFASMLTPDIVTKWAFSPEAPRITAMLNGLGPDATRATVNSLAQLIGRANRGKEPVIPQIRLAMSSDLSTQR